MKANFMEGAVLKAQVTEEAVMKAYITEGSEPHGTRGDVVAEECATDGRGTGLLLNNVLGTIFKQSEEGTLAGNSSRFSGQRLVNVVFSRAAQRASWCRGV